MKLWRKRPGCGAGRAAERPGRVALPKLRFPVVTPAHSTICAYYNILQSHIASNCYYFTQMQGKRKRKISKVAFCCFKTMRSGRNAAKFSVPNYGAFQSPAYPAFAPVRDRVDECAGPIPSGNASAFGRRNLRRESE